MSATDEYLSRDIRVVAIIGAGASGTLAAVHLMREAGARRLPLRVAVIDRRADNPSDVLADAERAAPSVIRVSHVASHVVAIRRGCGHRALRLHLAAEGRIDADVAILATGLAATGSTGDPLLRSLIDGGLARMDRHGLGLETDSRGAILGADGTTAGDIYALGQPRRGLRREQPAIPEIRDRAASIARSLAAQIAHADPGSAA